MVLVYLCFLCFFVAKNATHIVPRHHSGFAVVEC